MDDVLLKEIVIVNESRDRALAGDICIFRSANAACDYLEAWWVEEGHGFAFTGEGARITLAVETDRRWIGRFKKVVIAEQVEMPTGAEIVRGWLMSAALSVHRARSVVSEKQNSPNCPIGFDADGPLEGLIRYIGFTA